MVVDCCDADCVGDTNNTPTVCEPINNGTERDVIIVPDLQSQYTSSTRPIPGSATNGDVVRLLLV